jgi:NAD(P)-dependent dehydrogenase (short-subunit alcohol dehydrogenase family)
MSADPHLSGALAGKRCAVTGASTGIGAAVARALAGQGAVVAAFARRFTAERIGALAAGEVSETHLDVTSESEVEARFAELGRIDLVVNAAGVGAFAPVIGARVDDLRAMLEVHVVGTFLCSRAALRMMRDAGGGGHIVNVCSIAARDAFVDCSGYTAAKAGQLGLTRVLAEEARAFGVRVTALLPGATDTPIWDDRPGFDRSRMMSAAELAALVVDIARHPGLAIGELVVQPPRGNL